MNKKLLTMVTTGAIAISNMNFAFAEGFMATPDDSDFPMFVDGGFIPGDSVPKGEHPIFKIPNAHIPELEMLIEEINDEAVEPGDDIVDDVLSGEEYEEEESEADDSMDEEPIEDEEVIDEAEMERLEREEHEKELAEQEKAEEEDDDEIMDEIEKDVEKYDKENEEDTIGGIDDDYYDVGEEPDYGFDDSDIDIDDDEEEEVKKSNNKEVVSNENNSNTNVSNNTAGAIDNSSSQDKEIEKQANEVIANADDTKVDEDKTFKELEEYQNGKGNSSGNPKTGDMGIIGSIAGMIVGLGGIILRKKL